MEDISTGVREMAETLQTREKELQQAKRQLESTVQDRTLALNESETHLEQVQQSLMQNEKMAALGRAMAGFTHEVNNPLSIGIASASLLESLTGELAEDKAILASHQAQLKPSKRRQNFWSKTSNTQRTSLEASKTSPWTSLWMK
jgi:phosphoglycerate-specific signal transduction histidine kinase